MNILLIDVEGSFLDFALRCTHFGHNVRWFLGPNKKDGSRQVCGDGLVQKVAHWEPHMNWADLIVTADNVKYTHHLEGFRNRGYPIFGPNKESTSWELDRDKGQRILQKHGIETIPSIKFTNYGEAKNHVMKHMSRFVSKPNGDADKALSYVSKSPADMCFMLDHWKKSNPKPEFILQEFIPGIEMAVGGWFGQNGFSQHFCENFEHKKLMNNDLGVNTGEMGTVLKYTTESKLADEMLKPLTGELHRIGYTGYIDVAVIIDEKGQPWPLEFTCRPGWPLFQIQQSAHVGDSAQWMLDLIDGKDTLEVKDEVSLGVVLAIPDFPYGNITKKENCGYPIYGITSENINHLHFAECKLDKAPVERNGKIVEDECMCTAGDYVLIASNTAPTVKQAKKKAYKVLKEIEVPNSPMYRTDIGDRLEEQLPKLHKHGYATSFEFGE